MEIIQHGDVFLNALSSHLLSLMTQLGHVYLLALTVLTRTIVR